MVGKNAELPHQEQNQQFHHAGLDLQASEFEAYELLVIEFYKVIEVGRKISSNDSINTSLKCLRFFPRNISHWSYVFYYLLFDNQRQIVRQTKQAIRKH